MLQVHACRTSLGEQYAATFPGHLGAVYRVQESPFEPDLFLTASEDWTIRLWSKSKVAHPSKHSTGMAQVQACFRTPTMIMQRVRSSW